MFEWLKEEKVKVEEELKMKSGLFIQLEENYEMLRNRLHVKENEKHAFCGEISILERKLDSEITLSKVVKNRLEFCKQALAHEENQRRCLQSQLLESESCNEDIKSKLERLTIEKDVCKEMECKILQIEEENKELVLAVKKLKESQIQEAVNSSLIIELLQNKFNTLDEINKDTANEELVKSSCRGNEVEFELQRWKSIAEKLQVEKEWVTNEKDQMINKLLTEKEKLMNMIDDMFQWIDKLAREERRMMGALRSSAPDFDEN
ncbi:uncharacterized protein At4g38062-like [Helianthus annuus]|uniref:uncharacterized protein At4g38062-like n=1 Tax=Helianthus annuus TaxID=4232 RepID=UPI0016530611|nr:uncharacterized protein At4g38062-like [Helianthus annuus]